MNKPDLKAYKHLTPFKLSCITNFPFIEADFDAITNYELLSLIVKYLNDVIAETNNVSENVEELALAFNKLLEDVDDAIEEQNATIEAYFNDINIQTFVDNKIDEMVENKEFLAIVEEALLDLYPDAFNAYTRVNVLDFGNDLVEDTNRSYISTVFLTPENKKIVIDILNDMKEKEETRYYFVNKSDEILNNLYYLQMDSTDIANNRFQLVVNYDLAGDYSISYNDDYIVRQSYNITLTDDVITDYTTGYTHGVNTYKLLKTDNQVAYTPANAYEPATKDYVDNNSGGGSSSPAYYIEIEAQSYFNPTQFTLTNTDKTKFLDILNDAHTNGYTSFYLNVVKPSEPVTYPFFIDMLGVNWSTDDTYYEVFCRCVITGGTINEIMAYNYNLSAPIIGFMRLAVTIVSGEATNIIYSDVDGYVGRYLPLGNNAYFEPQTQYDPATKDYVDTRSFTEYTAFLSIFSGASSTTDPVSCYKKGLLVNLRGTIEVSGNVGLSGLDVTLPDAVCPNGLKTYNFEGCYTIGYLNQNGTTSAILCKIIYVLASQTTMLAFNSIDGSTINLTTGDLVSFNISYMINPYI